MSINYVKDDYDDFFTRGATVLVNTVNCVGVMGKGIALSFRAEYPHMYNYYVRYCGYKLLRPGELMLWPSNRNDVNRLIINAATKDHWKNPSKMDWVLDCLSGIRKVLEQIPENQIVNIPALGCGNGGLNWETVKDHTCGYLEQVVDRHIQINIYEPQE